MSYDLIIRPPLAAILSSNEKRLLVEDFRKETAIDAICELTIYCDSASPADAKILEDSISDGEFNRQVFDEFCAVRGLARTTEEERGLAAKLFLDVMWGQDLFSISLPACKNDARHSYHKIVDFVRRHALILHDPQSGQDIVLADPGEFPPLLR